MRAMRSSLTFCTGALGVRADNDLRAMVAEFALGSGFCIYVRRSGSRVALAGIESFFEAAHLEGDADLIGIMIEVVDEERRRELCKVTIAACRFAPIMGRSF